MEYLEYLEDFLDNISNGVKYSHILISNMKYLEILTFYQGVITYVVKIFLCSFCFTLALQNNMTLNKTTIIIRMLLDSFFSCFFSSQKNI